MTAQPTVSSFHESRARGGSGFGRSGVFVTGRLRSNGAVLKEIGAADRQETGRWVNNRAGGFHLPHRRREQAMRRRNLRKFASLHASDSNHFSQERCLSCRQPTPFQGQPHRRSHRVTGALRWIRCSATVLVETSSNSSDSTARHTRCLRPRLATPVLSVQGLESASTWLRLCVEPRAGRETHPVSRCPFRGPSFGCQVPTARGRLHPGLRSTRSIRERQSERPALRRLALRRLSAGHSCRLGLALRQPEEPEKEQGGR